MINIKKIFVLHTFVLFLCASLLPVAYADPVSKNQEKILCFEDRVDQGDQGDQDTNDAIVSFEQSVKFKSYDCQDLSGNMSGKDVQKSDGRTKRIPQYVPDGRNDGKITLTGKAEDKKAAIDESINPNEDRNSEVVQERAKRPADAQARTACRAAGDKSDAGCRTEVNKGIRTRDERGRARAKMTEDDAVRVHGQDGNSEVVQKRAKRPADAQVPQSNSKKGSNNKNNHQDKVNLMPSQKPGSKKPGSKKPSCSLHDSVHC